MDQLDVQTHTKCSNKVVEGATKSDIVREAVAGDSTYVLDHHMEQIRLVPRRTMLEENC